MPPPKNQDLTFLGWLEEFAKLPLTIPQQTLALYRSNYTKDYILLRTQVKASSNVRDSEVQLAFAQGSAESLLDIEGVNSVVNLVDLVKSPKSTITDLLESTVNDIRNLDELKQLKAGTVMTNLTRGVTVDEDGHNLSDPQNPILKMAGIKFPLVDSAGKSLFQTSVDITPGGRTSTYEDRYVAETGKKSDNLKLQSYSNLGEAIARLAGSGNAVGDRREARNDSLVEFNRSMGKELNLDLDKTFSYERINGTKSTGRLETALANSRGNVDAITSNSANLSNVLGITQAEFDALGAGTQQYLRLYVKSESFGLKINADPSAHFDIIDKVNAQPNVYGIKITPHPTDPFGSITVTPHPLATRVVPTNIQDQWKNFAKPNLSAKNRIEAFEGLRMSYMKNGDYSTAWAVATDDLGLAVTGTRYGGVVSKGLYIEDLTFEHEKSLVETSMWFDVNNSQIKRDILNRVKANPALATQAASLYATERAAKIAAGMNATAATTAAQLAQDNFWRDRTNDTLKRVSTATKSLDLANNLFYAATTRQILEDIQNGKFVSSAFIATRLLYTLPIGPKSIRGARSLGTLIDPSNYAAMPLRALGWIGEKETPGAAIAKGLGIAFEEDKKGLFGTVGFENRAAIQHQIYTPGAGGRLEPSGIWKTIVFTHSDAQGYFGKNSIYDELLKLSTSKIIDPTAFLEDPQKLHDFITAARSMMPTAAGINPITAANDAQAAAKALGFNNFANSSRLDALEANVFKALKRNPTTGAWELPWLEKLFSKGKLPKNERWRFLGDVVKNGYAGVAAKKYMGVLNLYNRAANGVRDFLYKSVIWGSFGASIPFIGPYVLGPLRNLLSGLGFSEEAGLARVIAKTKFFKRTRLLGKSFSYFANNPNSPSGRYFIRQVFGKAAANMATKMASSAAGKLAMQALAKIFGALAGAATGGISYVLMFAGGTIWRASLKLMKLDIKGAIITIRKDVITLLIVAKKVILFPFYCGCLAIGGSLILLWFMVFAIFSFFVRYDEPVGGGTYGNTAESAKLTVNKTVNVIDADTIEFEITVTRKGLEDVTITTFQDNLSFTPDCDVNAGKTAQFGEPGFIGTADKTPSDLALLFQNKVLNDANASISAKMRIDGITDKEATYTNSVQVWAADDGSNSATDTAAHYIGEGGCANCPAGWPIQLPAKVSQGPGGGYSHATYEAVDFIAPNGGGRNIYATHNGIVRMPLSNADCIGSTTSYGCHIRLESMDGNYETLYGHLNGLNMSLKDKPVKKGQLLGQMGSTGNSTGPHLHYEFPTVNYACIPNFPMRLRNVAGDQYVPETIQRACDDGSCTQTFN